jgi:Xaa-Pro aminopeptidase
MYKYFDREFFSGNRKRLRELFVGTAPIVITANGALQRNGDSTYPFRQDSSFWYLTGINDPDVVLVMDRNKEYLIVPEQSQYQEIFDGATNEDRLKAVSGIDTVHAEKEGWKQLGNRLGKAKYAATLSAPVPYVKPYGFYSNPARAALISRMKEHNEAIELLDLRTHITRMRMVKQPGELAAIQAAIDITAKAIKSVRNKTHKHEYEIEAALTSTFRKNGASGHGFTPIVSSGAKTCILHDGNNDGPIEEGDLVLLDIGAEVENYSADISRTYTQGTPTKRQKDVYQAVLAVQEYALSLQKPGATVRENEVKIEHYMGEKLRELGLIKTIDKDSVRKFYPHATSHFLGLDVHDVGDYERELEPGMVLTVEPGIYIPAEKIGVRIEDDIVITADGYEILTQKLPRESL